MAATRNTTSAYSFLGCCIFLGICFSLLGQSTAERKLKHVTVVFRHGDRSPIQAYPNDPYKEDSWPDGFGQLTQLGMMQQYELGLYLRKRYFGFLSKRYSSQEVYVISTDLDRTIMSAQANLAGLFPPVGQQIWNKNFNWQPIAVHSVPMEYDDMLLMMTNKCSLYNELLTETYESKEFNDLMKPYTQFLKYLQEKTGYSAKQLSDGHTLWQLYDTLLCESIHNYTLPAWVTKDVMGTLLQLSKISLTSFYGIYKQHEKSRLMGGVLLKVILEKIKKQATAPSSKPKLKIFSAHDTTITALQMALNVFNRKLPPYASCHFFELYQDAKGDHSIEMYYRNDSSLDPYPVILPGCTFSCPLDRFTNLTASVIVQDLEKECEGVHEHNSFSPVPGLIISVVILSALVLSLLTLFICNRKKSSYASMS